MANPNGRGFLLPTSHSAPDNTPNRPPSSASRRPATSASIRPSSSLSNRPISRLSHHAQTRHVRSRLIPLCRSLVTQITGLHEDDDFHALVDSVFQRLESTSQVKAAAVADFSAINKRISGFVKRAKVDMNDSLAEALSVSYGRLKAQAPLLSDLDEKIKSSRLPHHMQFLLELSTPATDSALAYADLYIHNLQNPPPPPISITWEEILADEPFEGDHWDCLRKPNRNSFSDSASSLSLSIWSSDDEYDRHRFNQTEPSLEPVEDDQESQPELPMADYVFGIHDRLNARKLVEELQERQYWRNKSTPPSSSTLPFDLGIHLTLGHSLQVAIGGRSSAGSLQGFESWIQEQDAIREVLMVLQGRKSTLFDGPSEDNPHIKVVSNCPRLLHLSLSSQWSLLSSFATFSTTAASLRRFSSQCLGHHQISPNPFSSRTLEAYADAVAKEIWHLDRWAANQEELMAKACAGITPDGSSGSVVSLLAIEHALRNQFGEVLVALHDIVNQIQSQEDATPATTATLILDQLTKGVEQQRIMGSESATQALFRVFVHTAEPMWSMVGQWLKNGMKADDREDELDEEFFIQKASSSTSGGLLDPDFWIKGYVLRDEDHNCSTSPGFLLEQTQIILESGKTTGLLRLLDAPGLERIQVPWPIFRDLMFSQKEGQPTGSVTVNRLSYLISNEIGQYFTFLNGALIDFLVNECDMRQHIHAIEDLYFLGRGDAMTDFTDVLFSKMDTNQDWKDFHFLNSSFRDVVELRRIPWVDVTLVRLSYYALRERSIRTTVSALDGLGIEYAVPFPLTYVFSPEAMRLYSDILVFLLQIKRAKYVLEKILVRSHSHSIARGRDDHLKVLYSLRSRLSWFISTLLNFVLTYASVIHAEVSRFHSAVQKASSLDEILQLHNDHLNIIMGRCLLQKQTSALQRAILSILDIALQFSELFISFAGDTISDCNQSLLLNYHRKRRHVRRNVIGFAPADPVQQSDSESDDEFQTPGELVGQTLEPPAPNSYANEDRSVLIDKMSSDLDSLVKFVRRGIETLAGGSSEAAPAFGVLSFALEDWEIRGVY